MNTDGTVPEDNPFEDSYVYTRGHRNPQGIDWHPETGEAYNVEHGTWRMDELNRLEPGENYGWSQHICDHETSKGEGDFVPLEEPSPQHSLDVENEPPVKCFKDWTIAPSGITFVDDPESPWYGDLFIAGLRGNHVHRVKFEDGEATTGEILYIPDSNSISQRVRDVEWYNGSLYVTGDRGGMVKLTPETGSQDSR